MLEEDTAEFVLAARETLDLTQAELAEKIGRNRKAIIRYEQGEPLPTGLHLAIKQLLTEHKAKEDQRRKRKLRRKQT